MLLDRKQKLYFKKNGSLYKLSNYKYTNGFINKELINIFKSYKKVNKDAKLFAKPNNMTVSENIFTNIQKDLKIENNEIRFYLGASNKLLLVLTAYKGE